MFAVTAFEARRLGAIRAVVGAFFVVRTTPLLEWVPGLLRHHGGPLYGWPDEQAYRMGLFGVLLPIALVKALCVVRTGAALLFALGVHARVAGVTAALAGYLVWSQEPLSFIFTYNTLLVATLLVALGDGAEVHTLLGQRGQATASPVSSVWLLRGFVVSIYVWGGIAKLNAAWLAGETLRRLATHRFIDGAFSHLVLASSGARVAAAWGTVAAELGLAVLLLVPRTRVVAVIGACGLHAIFETTAHPDIFGWLMVTLLAAFWPPRRTT
ncbi:MAG: HTTM domain-containing protein [Myxococcales bacterium]|nr:HTTM domain-containing protein [Myxococcales bacterium]